MNAIPIVKTYPKDSLTEQDTVIYFYLLSKCYESEGDIISHVSTEAIKRTFKLDEDECEQVLDTLYDLDLIAEEDDNIIVGMLNGDGRKVLYCEEYVGHEDLSSVFDSMLGISESFLKSAKRAVSRSIAQKANEVIVDTQKTKLAEIKVKECANLFIACSEIVMQEEYRELDKAEYGALKKLLTKLGGVKMVKVILNYVENYDRWGTFPNVFNMVKNKDAVYAETTEKSIGDETF